MGSLLKCSYWTLVQLVSRNAARKLPNDDVDG